MIPIDVDSADQARQASACLLLLWALRDNAHNRTAADTIYKLPDDMVRRLLCYALPVIDPDALEHAMREQNLTLHMWTEIDRLVETLT